MTKILYISDSPTFKTGYGKVAKELLQGMYESGYDVRAIGCGMADQTHDFPYLIYPTDPQKDYWGYRILPHILNTFEPDVIMTLSDPWAVEPMLSIIDNFPVYWIGYFPIDGKPIPKQWHYLIDRMNKAVVISKYAQDAVKEVLPRKKVELLYHGVDTNIFKPHSEEEIKLSRELNGWQDKFIVLNVNRNQIRKQIPITIKGFAEFARDKEDVMLVLRMQQYEEMGWDIPDLFDRFKLKGKAFIINAPGLEGISEEALAELYNMADIHVSTTAGEGFGLTTLESISCGTPVLITDCSNSRELVHSEKLLIKVKEMIICNRNIEQAYPDPADLAQKLQYFYNNRQQLKELRNQGREFALNMTWDHVRKELVRILKDVEKELPDANKKLRMFIV